MGIVRSTVGVAAGTAVAVGAVGLGLYWLYSRAAGGNGWGFGLGGGGGDSILGVHPPTGPASVEGGDGGTASEPGGGQANPGGAGGQGGQGSASSGSGQGGKPSGGSGGTGGSGGDSGGGGQGGGGVGGGSGGGVGQGSGSGTAGGEDEGGSTGDDNGGGADEGHYDPWGGALIDADLPPPDLSAGKLSAVRQTVEDLVLGAVLEPGASEPGLPAPLHSFNPDYGGLLLFWADVALHHTYDLPPGRLDPDIPSHIPWINLWLDILAYVSTVEAQVNPGGAIEASASPAWAGLGSRSATYWALDHHIIARRGYRRSPLWRLLSVDTGSDANAA